MTIIERLQQNKELEPHKIALIVDDIQYTYGELYDAILSADINNTSHIVNFTQSKETLKTKVLLIKELSFVEQLTQWLGAQSLGRKLTKHTPPVPIYEVKLFPHTPLFRYMAQYRHPTQHRRPTQRGRLPTGLTRNHRN